MIIYTFSDLISCIYNIIGTVNIKKSFPCKNYFITLFPCNIEDEEWFIIYLVKFYDTWYGQPNTFYTSVVGSIEIRKIEKNSIIS